MRSHYSTRFARSIKNAGLAAALILSSKALFAADAAPTSAPAAAAALTLSPYQADGNGFNVSAVLVSGQKEAVLIDASFTQADAHRLVAEVLASGKHLSTVYISHGDPDYYFGLETIKQAFPQVRILASKPTVAHINATLAKKLQTWGPKLGANGPQHPIVPEILEGDTITLEGQKLEVRGLHSSAADSTYVWIPSLKAVVGGVNVFAGLHLWTADSQSPAARASWIAVLDGITALHPTLVVPGHATAGVKMDLSAVQFTREYLLAFEQELALSKNSAELIAAMKQRYPQLGGEMLLTLGAKVNKGEMKW